MKKFIQAVIATLTLGKLKGKVKKVKSYMENTNRGGIFPENTFDTKKGNNIFDWRNGTK